MKKLTALLFTLICVSAFALAGCSEKDTFTEKSYSSGETEIEKVTVQVEDREINIGTSDDDKVYIDYFDGEKEFLDITVSESKELTVKLLYNKTWTDFIGTKPSEEYRKINIRIPDGLLASLSASTTNEDIKTDPLSVTERVDLVTNGGNIVCERVNVGKAIGLSAKNGNITGSVIGGWDDFSISCTVKKGDCNLPALKEGGEKSLTADCNNGDIKIEFVK